jgi:hypothetical protein
MVCSRIALPGWQALAAAALVPDGALSHRAQGPHPFAGGRPTEENQRNAYYYKALEEAGFQAREIAGRLQKDTSSLWDDLQSLLIRAQKAL